MPSRGCILLLQQISGGALDSSFRTQKDSTADVKDSSRKRGRGATLQLLLHILIRTLLPLISLVLSIAFSQLSTILYFIGGLFGSGISIVIPTLCYLRIFRRELSRSEKALVLLHTAIGAICAALTVYVALCKK